jgi:hypothetical protein
MPLAVAREDLLQPLRLGQRIEKILKACLPPVEHRIPCG